MGRVLLLHQKSLQGCVQLWLVFDSPFDMTVNSSSHLPSSAVLFSKMTHHAPEFPRIAHVVNGPLQGKSVTRDDLRFSEGEIDSFVTGKDCMPFNAPEGSVLWLTVEEKIDGANLGVFLDPTSGGALRCVNRGHVVCSETQTQFKQLDSFIAAISGELYDLFDTVAREFGLPSVGSAEKDSTVIPGYDVTLYGEWCVAKHSVGYDKLPSYFLAFDIAVNPDPSGNASSAVFLTQQDRHKFLTRCCPSVAMVPLIYSKPIPPPAGAQPPLVKSWADVHALWHKVQSTFSTKENMEGAVVRVELHATEEAESKAAPGQRPVSRLLKRCKVVRDDFIEGIENAGHWTKKAMVKNSLDPTANAALGVE